MTSGQNWDRYWKWNTALADVVYGPEAAGTAAFLDPEEEVLIRVAESAGESGVGARDALIAAVRPTLNGPAQAGGMFRAHIAQLRQWQSAEGEPPPVIALLAVLCLAAEEMREADGMAANNYYDRLMPHLGIEGEDNKKRVIRAYRQHSFDLWESLNRWLESLYGERGLPTAYSYAHAHVGLPLSQALIRATDREKLNEFFEELGLEPHARLAPHDMEPMLSEWISRAPSPASHQIQALWKRSGARERITDIACQLLKTWEPQAGDLRLTESSPRGLARRSSLSLMGLLRTFPSTVLELHLVGPQIGGENRANLLDPTSGEELGTGFELVDLPDGRWRLVSTEELDQRSLLEGIVRLRHESGAILERHPRRLVPLKRDPLLQAFIEVERLGLGEDGLLLCQVGLAPIVGDALSKIARPGFQLLDPSPPGCPVDWSVISHVQILGSLSDVLPPLGDSWPLELNVLLPIATSQLVLGGGLQLPGRVRRWSSLAPPEIRVATQDATALVVKVERVGTFERSTVELEQRFDSPAAVVDLASVELPDGDYEISASSTPAGNAKPQRVSGARLRLRSADAPNQAPSRQPPLGSPIFQWAWGALSAEEWDGLCPVIRGAKIVGSETDDSSLIRTDIGTPAWWTRRGETSSTGPADHLAHRPMRQIVFASTNPDDCFRTGAHFLQLPPFYGGTTKSTVDGVCKYCGLVKRFPARYRLRRSRPSGRTNESRPPPLDVSVVIPVSATTGVSPDVALDALSHDRAGPMSWFEQIALQVEPSQLFVHRFIHALERLGHVEVSRDIRTLRPLAWEVLKPTFVGTHDEGFYLTGHRSSRMIDAVEDAAAELGLTFEREHQGVAAPHRLRILTDSVSILDRLCETVHEVTGVTINIAPDAARALAALLPQLSDVLNELPRQAMIAATDVRRWESDVARWRPVGDAHTPGAYQIFGPPTVYCLRDEQDIDAGTMRRLDARLAKHATAQVAGEQIIGYDAAAQTLYVPLGADLPGLYDRVAVLCLGLLPVEDQTQGVLKYRGVPSNLAEHLAARLQ